MIGVFHNLFWLGGHIVPGDHYDGKFFQKKFPDIIVYVYVPNNYFDDKNSENKNIDLAQMKNRGKSQVSPFLLKLDDFCIGGQKWIRRQIFFRRDRGLKFFAYANLYVYIKSQKVSDHIV